MTKKPEKPSPDQNAAQSAADPKAANRRKILKGTLAGAGAIGVSGRLPTTWTKPVSEAVVLPAHAQATCGIRSEAVFVSNSEVINGTPLTQEIPFEFTCGDRSANLEAPSDYCSDANSFNVSLLYMNVSLDRPPGAAGVASVTFQHNLGNFDQNAINFPVNANQTEYPVSVDAGGMLQDAVPGTQDLTILVNVPGFPSARIRFNIFASGCPS